MKNAVSQIAKTRCGNPYKPCGNEYFGATFSKFALKNIKKDYLENVSATRFQNVGKPYKTNGKQGYPKVIFACVKPL